MPQLPLPELVREYETRWTGELDSRTKWAFASKVLRIEFLYDLIRVAAEGPLRFEEHRASVRSFLKTAHRKREEILGTEPGGDLERRLSQWHTSV